MTAGAHPISMSGGRPAMKSVRGFTLLELLIATAVGAVVLLVIQTTFFGALRLHTTAHARTDADLRLHRALAIVRRDFAGLMLPGVMAGELQTTSFSSGMTESFGEPVGPEIHTSSGRVDGWSPFGEAQRVSYFLAPGADGGSGAGKDLLRVVQRNLLPVQELPGEPQVLLPGVAEATIEFFDGFEWTDVWDSEASSTLPTALKLRLVMSDEDGRPAPAEPIELLVPMVVRTTATAMGADTEGLLP